MSALAGACGPPSAVATAARTDLHSALAHRKREQAAASTANAGERIVLSPPAASLGRVYINSNNGALVATVASRRRPSRGTGTAPGAGDAAAGPASKGACAPGSTGQVARAVYPGSGPTEAVAGATGRVSRGTARHPQHGTHVPTRPTYPANRRTAPRPQRAPVLQHTLRSPPSPNFGTMLTHQAPAQAHAATRPLGSPPKPRPAPACFSFLPGAPGAASATVGGNAACAATCCSSSGGGTGSTVATSCDKDKDGAGSLDVTAGSCGASFASPALGGGSSVSCASAGVAGGSGQQLRLPGATLPRLQSAQHTQRNTRTPPKDSSGDAAGLAASGIALAGNAAGAAARSVTFNESNPAAAPAGPALGVSTLGTAAAGTRKLAQRAVPEPLASKAIAFAEPESSPTDDEDDEDGGEKTSLPVPFSCTLLVSARVAREGQHLLRSVDGKQMLVLSQ